MAIAHAKAANEHCVLCESGEHAPIDENTSDGFHTFKELYAHRESLTAALFQLAEACGVEVWRSRAHHPDDSPCYAGYFIVGMETGWGTITYHYPDTDWEDFRAIPELPHAPKWDGAEPDLTVYRLRQMARGDD